ncbi:hypothetical protein [Acidicapsa acidisoli]|uniref:hypothetical protein n=1 Tax=Acidicapsa acidisoli TaxID=1615681 RepID=UPI0021E07CE4|nr:hypothetical protein [Acidicapsa acidisoli]
MRNLLRLCLVGSVSLIAVGVSVRVIHAQAPVSSELAATMKLIQDKMSAEGPVQYRLYSSHDIGNGTMREHEMGLNSITQSNFVADAAGCRIDYQDETYFKMEGPNADHQDLPPTPRQIHLDLKSGRFVITSESVSILDGVELQQQLIKRPEFHYRTDSQVFILQVRLNQSIHFDLFFHEKANAETVTKAMQRAIQLCNPSASKDPF